MAFRSQALDEEAAAVIVNLSLLEGLLPVGLAIGATPALHDIEITPGLATQLKELALELILDLPLMSLGLRVHHRMVGGN